ncbi:MAG: hypothetical protein LBQ02_00760 [Candidatus Nomurabacteria bacterium]|jgi:uncharacterized membrane protein YoaK (UPF0700 family)|nr:hypothetical protein [Candidatus Nomurabacteria bacterium]
MKELIYNFKEIWQADRKLIWRVVLLFVLGAIVATVGFVMIEPKQLQVLSHYTDLGKVNNYSDSKWQFQFVFPVMALLIGVLHSVLVPRIFIKSGGAFARLFISASVVILFILLLVMLRVIDTNRMLG